MNHLNIFSTPIWQTKLDFDSSIVANKCIEMRDNNYPNRVISNRGGWQSELISLRDFTEFQNMEREIISKIDIIAKNIHPSLNFEISSCWINVNEKGDFNGIHNHISSALSVVVYIQVDDKTGNIVFIDDHSPIRHYPLIVPSDSEFFRLKESVTPSAGMMLTFPSWVPHMVEPSQSDNTRVSIALNLNFKDYKI